MVIFSILLLISRLVPAFQLTDSTQVNKEETKDDQKEHHQQSREQSMHEFVGLIRAYAKSGTYFVRKISAQALLPIMRFSGYIGEIQGCFSQLADKI